MTLKEQKEQKQLMKIVRSTQKLQELIHKSTYYNQELTEDTLDTEYLLHALMTLNGGCNETIREFIAKYKTN
jgi:hypothetical protein